MTTPKEDLTKKVADWLNSQGYPLEMIVASAFQRTGFNVSSSNYYTDFETQESREIDVIAKSLYLTKGASLDFSCHIECKSTREKPWIIFRLKINTDMIYPPYINSICSEGYLRFWSATMKSRYRVLKVAPSFFKAQHIGYGLTQAFTSGQDVPYKALMSSVKSAIDHTHRINQIFDNHRNEELVYHNFNIAVPVIVIEGRLFEYAVDEKGITTLEEIETGIIRWKGANPLYASPLVHIITRDTIEQFTINIRKVFEEMRDFTHESIETLIEVNQLKVRG